MTPLFVRQETFLLQIVAVMGDASVSLSGNVCPAGAFSDDLSGQGPTSAGSGYDLRSLNIPFLTTFCSS